MNCNRRDFLKLAGASAVCLTLGQLGFNLDEAFAYAGKLKIEGAKEFISICPFCAVCCQVIAYVKDGRLVSVEGDPDFPVNQGSLCAKGAGLMGMYTGKPRLMKPLYRAPYSDKWEEKDWDWTLEQIARRVKEARDRDIILQNQDGKTVNRLEQLFQLVICVYIGIRFYPADRIIIPRDKNIFPGNRTEITEEHAYPGNGVRMACM